MKQQLWLFETIKKKSKKLYLILPEALQAAAVLGCAGLAAGWMNAIFLEKKSLTETAPVLLALFLVMACIPLLGLWKERLCLSLADVLCRRVREKLHEKLLDEKTLAETVRNILPHALDEVNALELWFTRVLPTGLGIVVRIPLILIISAYIDPITGALMLVTLPIAPFLLYLVGHVTKVASENEWKEMQSLTKDFSEILSAIPTLKIFGAEESEGKRVAQMSDIFRTAALRVLRLSFVSAFALELITTLSIAIIAVGVGLRLLAGELDFYVAFFILLIAPEFYQPLRAAGAAFHSGMTAATAEENLKAALKESLSAKAKEGNVSRIFDGEKTDGYTQRNSIDSLISTPPAIAAKELSYTFPLATHPILPTFSFQIPAGKITAVIGPSGCGKSTLLSILAGLAAPYSGSLQIQDSTGRSVELSALTGIERRKLISYVPQEPHLLSGTLMENVSLLSSSSNERIEQALDVAHLSVRAHPFHQGLFTRLGEGGQAISAGQRKRLGIARALFQARPIILLDEPTAALDEDTAELVRKTILTGFPKKTVIIATHDERLLHRSAHILSFKGQSL